MTNDADPKPVELPRPAVRRADFSDLVGQWTPDPEFDAILSQIRQIDPDKWK